MCGIAGVLAAGAGRREGELAAAVTAMAARMVHRGPDGSGHWVDAAAGVALSHRRLSVVDLSDHGAQPMSSRDGRWVLTYNGEIYGHRELAAELAAGGVALRGHSDTEVLVEAVARWGLRRTLDRIDGMFAFALWDRRERRLHLVRDRLGEKPLYHGRLGTGEYVFASTVDALEAHPAFDRAVDRDALALYFRHKYVPAPWSIYDGIWKLEPGCLLELDEHGRSTGPTPYWSHREVLERGPSFSGTPADAVDELDSLLRRSVRQRLVADVPVGAFLSGGIDSSTVVAIAQQELSSAVRTFTIGSTHGDFDESSDARKVADQLGAEHTELVVDDSEALAVVERFGSVHDEPFGDSSQVPTRLVAELARRDVTVALSGDGGDELFAGYNRYVWVPSIWRRMARLPVGLRRRTASALRRVPPGWWDRAARLVPEQRRPRMVGLKVAKVLGVADAASPEEVFHRLVSHWQDPGALVPGSTVPRTVHDDPGRWPRTSGIVEHMMALDTVTYLPDDVLAKVDRATMSVSLEARVPLLARDVVEFAASLPLEAKLRDGVTKWPLRQVLSRYVDPSSFERPKSGFGLPVEEWLRGPLRAWAEERLFAPECEDFVSRSLVERAWQEHLSGSANLGYELWDVVAFAEWMAARGR